MKLLGVQLIKKKTIGSLFGVFDQKKTFFLIKGKIFGVELNNGCNVVSKKIMVAMCTAHD